MDDKVSIVDLTHASLDLEFTNGTGVNFPLTAKQIAIVIHLLGLEVEDDVLTSYTDEKLDSLYKLGDDDQ